MYRFRANSLFCAVFILLCSVSLVRCKKDKKNTANTTSNIPLVETNFDVEIKVGNALIKGKVIKSNSAIIEQGFLIDSTPYPSTITSTKIIVGNGSQNLEYLFNLPKAIKKYYFRAFAKNQYGIGYGNVVSFETLNLEMVNIPGGTFIMGSATNDVYAELNEKTPHNVTLSSFKMSKYEISNELFCTFLNNNKIGFPCYIGDTCLLEISMGAWESPTKLYYGGSITDPTEKWRPWVGFEKRPVTRITWYAADKCARYFGGRLPTEAEWEYACRAKTTSHFWSGNCLNTTNENFNCLYNNSMGCLTDNPIGIISDCGEFQPNPFGLYDMSGNVAEWCSDWFAPYSNLDATNPKGPTTGQSKVIRGGTFLSNIKNCRSAKRWSCPINSFISDEGDFSGMRIVTD